ncbi:MFS transporter [Burkholderia arboris]|uniref:MFS transporter n=1 Tax=Burkholderia arboris TaxID=488730 RepID=UPI00158EE97A|nr:MFS transporter [Burkholderia arboris]
MAADTREGAGAAAGASAGDGVTGAQVALMATLCAFSAGSLYYNQVMAAAIASSFGVAPATASTLSIFGHVGYVAGLVLLVPLGDRYEKRALVARLAWLGALALAGAALAPCFALEALATLASGVFATTASLTVPFAATLAAPARRGRVVGRVMLGLLIGIVASRVVSGALTEALGWRAMFAFAALAQALLAWLVSRRLPRSPATTGESYASLLRSLHALYRDEPRLRLSAWRGALLFGAFSALWASYALHLRHTHPAWGAAVDGLFGLAGIAGALIAPAIGRAADVLGPERVFGRALACLFVALVLFAAWPGQVAVEALAIVLLDMGIQAAMICNQTVIYALRPAARTRINGVYMIVYFIGGTCGTALAVPAWTAAGWPGVLGVCSAFVAAGAGLHAGARWRARAWRGDPTV